MRETRTNQTHELLDKDLSIKILAVRVIRRFFEVDEMLSLAKLTKKCIVDGRHGKNVESSARGMIQVIAVDAVDKDRHAVVKKILEVLFLGAWVAISNSLLYERQSAKHEAISGLGAAAFGRSYKTSFLFRAKIGVPAHWLASVPSDYGKDEITKKDKPFFRNMS